MRAVENIIDATSEEHDQLNYGSSKYIPAVKMISKLLRNGLGKRVSLIYIHPPKMKEWAVNDNAPNDLEKLYIGLQFDTNHCFNIIEKGPRGNLPEVCILYILDIFKNQYLILYRNSYY